MPGYISEFSYSNTGSPAFVEIAVPEGIDVSGYTLVVYSSNGKVHATYSFGSADATILGQDVYTIQNEPAGSFPVVGTDAFALVDELGNVVQFIGQSSVSATQGPADGMTSTDVGQASGSTSLQSDDGGATYYQQTDKNPGTIPCFTPGTLILTPEGEVPVENFEVGDLVVTADHGPQPIRYVARSEVSGPDIPENRQPILIPCGSLGPDLPKRDLVVSGQHRMLLSWREVQKLHDVTEVLAPAKGLVPLPGVRVTRGVRHVQYIHLLLDRHEVLYAEGAATESFYPGPTMLRDMSKSERAALFHAVPELRDGVEAALGAPARKLLRVQETKKFVRKHRERLKAEVTKWDVDLAMERYEAERLAACGPHVAVNRAVA